MIDELFEKKFEKFKDLEIKSIVVEEENGCTFLFAAGMHMTIFDGGQSCRGHRWMTCDDDPEQFKGTKLTGVDQLDFTSGEDNYGDCTDCCFLRIDTTAGSFRLCMHNRHNGYYAGFYPDVKSP